MRITLCARDGKRVLDARFGEDCGWGAAEWWTRQGEAFGECIGSAAVGGQDDGDLCCGEVFGDLDIIS